MRETLAALLGLEEDIEVAAALAGGDQIVPAAGPADELIAAVRAVARGERIIGSRLPGNDTSPSA